MCELVVDRVGFKDVENALLTLNSFMKQDPINVTPLI